MSDTPETDKAINVMPAERFARQLERRLAAERAKREDLEKENKDERNAQSISDCDALRAQVAALRKALVQIEQISLGSEWLSKMHTIGEIARAALEEQKP